MSPANPADAELLRSLLEPLLEDFQYWFARSRTFLETEEISFLTADQHSDLLARVIQAQYEVTAAQSLFNATGKQIGVETSVLAPWHHLVSECWQVVSRFRLQKSAS